MIKQLRITVEGKIYDVTVEVFDEGSTSSARASRRAGGASAASAAAIAAPSGTGKPKASGTGAPGEILSPLAGTVAQINSAPGTEVKEGDVLVTLEAMKMMTSIPSPQSGKVKEVLIAVGDAVEEGQPVVILE